MNKINVEKVIDYTKVLKDNEILQDMDKILRNENTNLKLEIERLKEEYMILQNASDEVEEEKDKEIERLNNIINELEEEISKHIALCTDITLNDILDKLQELKGSDKEC